ncbi:GatB/YqeY domain-containing protein [Basidiobolus meristosporus CBS 931.73]|uniref:Altered inheritance of mitochondria protein 41 n=1 Tax=Basidiobolus meristosporus CBS 931.73 TaxID=1314790 RepID=A0A1Y1XY12_9FUNG|nr:GatB/YqeY domain-containing protein [Basidiobolus meristosporus CBS 931.73]|eukprot:ORX90632.1 GatB/YqeY domain-containing protein [Basidiobolus meristosporus CBS 931.73]
MRNKERTRLSVVKSILSDITYAEKAQGKSIKSDSEIAVLIQSAIKKRRESIASFESAGRSDLASNETEEVEILQKYLPEQLSEREIEAEVLKAIKETGAQSVKDIGKVMKAIQLDPAVAPKSLVAELVKKVLASAK